ncbi:MAG: PH domain-containing protein [bacterium]
MPSVITPRDGEKVLLTLRKNPNKFGKQIIKGLIFLLIPILAFIFFNNQIILTIAVVLLLMFLIYTLYYFLIWFYDVYIITNIRIICVNRHSLFSQEFSETDLSKIQDVTYSIKGIFATMFKYGTVNIRTSTGLTLELSDLSDPDEVQEMIRSLADVTHKKQNQEMSAAELIEYIAKQHKK